MGILGDVLTELKAAVQLAGRIDQKVEDLARRSGDSEAALRAIALDVRSQGERIAKLEKAEETMEERTALHLERALSRRPPPGGDGRAREIEPQS